MEEDAKLFSTMDRLKGEHRDLDHEISIMLSRSDKNELEVRRLKKRKLQLRDEILVIQAAIYPDIIA